MISMILLSVCAVFAVFALVIIAKEFKRTREALEGIVQALQYMNTKEN